jgi:hypothetical protein
MTSIELLKQDLDAELKLGTKMVVNWDMYIEMHKQEIIDARNDMQKSCIELANKINPHLFEFNKKDGEQYYTSTYGSKGSDETLKENHIVDTNEMVEVHPLEILRNKIKCEISELEPLSKYSAGYKQAFIDVENMIMDMLAQLPKQEISVKKQVIEILNNIDYHYDLKGDADWLMNEIINRLDNIKEQNLPQQEISDEEIYNEAKNHHNYYEWSAGAKWYREQLKQRQ